MRAATSSAIVPYNEPLEGLVLSLYADWESLLTTSIGCLVDSTPSATPWSPAVGLPWRHPSGVLATGPEVIAEWKRVKAGTCGAKRLRSAKDCPRIQSGKVCFAHNGWRTSETRSALKLARADAEALVRRRAASMWATLVLRFPTLKDAPADAQLGVLSWSWAMGPNRTGWPKFFAAIKAGDWDTCAKEGRISELGNSGVIPRNKEQVTLFQNAAVVVARGLPPEALYWPAALPR